MLEILFQSPNEIAFDLRPAEVRGDVERVLKITKIFKIELPYPKSYFFLALKTIFFLVLTRGDLF